MKDFRVEVCCGSADDVAAAYRAGADRVELNSSLFLGGLTPSVGELRVAKCVAPALPAMCMVRPRGGGFCYTELEFETMLADAEVLLDNGADGIVFGCLAPNGAVDEDKCRRLMAVIKDRPAVFHRAIDVVPNWRAALDCLIRLGVTRVLSSGQNPDAYWGADVLAEMVKYAAGKIEILPGGGVTPRNAAEVLRKTGCTQLHLGLHKTCLDSSTRQNPSIFFGGALYPPEDSFQIIDGEALGAFIGG